jgi:hypothetical protein
MGYGVFNEGDRWPGGEVTYYFVLPAPESPAHERAEEARETIKLCMQEWANRVNDDGKIHIKFTEKDANTQGARCIDLTQENGSNSSGTIGYALNGAKMTIIIGAERRAELASIPHEIGHLLGLAHENERNGRREDYNLADDALPMLCIYSPEADFVAAVVQKKDVVYKSYGDYDLQSIMHYPAVVGWIWTCAPRNPSPKSPLPPPSSKSKRRLSASDSKPSKRDLLVQAQAQAQAQVDRGEEKAKELCQNAGKPLNRPTAAQVLAQQGDDDKWYPKDPNDRWKPSAGDVATIRAIYPGPQQNVHPQNQEQNAPQQNQQQ